MHGSFCRMARRLNPPAQNQGGGHEEAPSVNEKMDRQKKGGKKPFLHILECISELFLVVVL